MITYKLNAAAAMTSVYIYRSDGMITYNLRAAAVMTSVYTLQFRWHDHVRPESSSSDDISMQIAIRKIYTYQLKGDKMDVTNELYIVVRYPCLVIAALLRIASCPIISTQCFRCRPQTHETSLTISTARQIQWLRPRVEIAHHNICCKELSLLDAGQKLRVLSKQSTLHLVWRLNSHDDIVDTSFWCLQIPWVG